MRERSIQFYAEESVVKLPGYESLLRRYPNLTMISDSKTFRLETMHREKQAVIFSSKRGPWLKPFHCYQQNTEYAYYSLDLAEGCQFDCVYCYLQTYLNHGALVVFVNHEDMLRELQSLQKNERNLWISTGLLSDSLLAEKYYAALPELSRCISSDSILELRSKADDISSLESSDIRRERVVISWSLNPEKLARDFEYGAASPAARINAASRAVKLGHRIAFHFDPMFYFEGWEEAYEELFEKIREFELSSIGFLSIGLFRYMPDLGMKIRNRFPFHSILTGEFFMDNDGKYHYLRAIRKEMYTKISRWLHPWKGRIPIFWSMETDPGLIGILTQSTLRNEKLEKSLRSS
jgi:spore photoproduct lyase